MKKKTKLGLCASFFTLGVLALSGCTANFCSVQDQSHMLYAYDNGITAYQNEAEKGASATVLDLTELNTYWGSSFTIKPEETIYVYTGEDDDVQVKDSKSYPTFRNNYGGLNAILVTATDNGIELPAKSFWVAMDKVALMDSLEHYFNGKTGEVDLLTIQQATAKYGYLKYTYTDVNKQSLWANWNNYVAKAKTYILDHGGHIDALPTTDFINQYQKSMNAYVTSNRGCITTTTDNYGYYGYDASHKMEVEIEAKSYSYGWSKGFFDGLLVWPIGALCDVLCNGMSGLGTGRVGSNTNGWAQLLTIVIVTVIVRALMFFVTYKQTASNAKMTELQPEISKIQNKYPNANSSQSEKARMADEMNKLYKKNKINPLSSILVLIVQFPVFICVWGGLQGSAWLSTGSFFGLSFADSISSVLFNGANWGSSNTSAYVALVLFILMAASQVLSMLIPQWQQKAKQKKVAKLGKNPAANSQNNKMKWFTYIMMAMIIFMGFSLPSAMGVYWLIGALFSIAQTLIVSAITARKAKEKK